ncbi:MAG: DUF1934 family protein [Oscillospiraceae bacterium]|jgi:uncharacterized beta-barrel protein YwiB (DUF1934 family)|nr:DUF1934 family protein [Oscillospiraceae bacterium]
MFKEKKNVTVAIKGVIDDITRDWEGPGEYALDGDTHFVAYNDYAGNAVTKTGIHIRSDALLLHRVGAITSDILFRPNEDTIVKYDAFGMQTTYILHTTQFRLYEMQNGIWVHLEYSLNDTNGHTEIEGIQDVHVFYE